MKNITFLAPLGATFSHDVYNRLASLYEAPAVSDAVYVPAKVNGEVLSRICEHGGYGCIAMETLAEGRVAEPLESFIELLKVYRAIEDCPFRICSAIKMRLHFCLMTRQEVCESDIKTIIAHPKALGACKQNILDRHLLTTSATSNGEAARLVAEDTTHADSAALGPQSAAEKYNLRVHNSAFEDKQAITTFFLLTPKDHSISVGKENRALIVFKLMHEPGAIVEALLPFSEENLNLIQIHSVHAGNGSYHFAIEIEVNNSQLVSFEKAMSKFKKCVALHLCFGPFKVLSE